MRKPFLRSGVPIKLKSRDELLHIALALRGEGRTVGWTNGCFDLLHAGHILYLQEAAQICDVLVVGLNSDASVRANKGPERPIIPEGERAIALAALECIDYVTLFHGDTTAPELEALRPDFYIKGGDYTVDTIRQEERRLVEGYGGRIHLIPGMEDRSTTALIARITAS